ncbi:OprO/OprP family phosphate-selective porin [Desulfoferrobacter suflitae]|uniref:OprO/OprP family phosphate-selective porin n=1 Tax=Desulfoferrobacter suflitae TaxID=2865782 RepID=UPI002164E3CF|nr:porin [Desulfoferrobacter suflitae]MCK8601767.1 porin [Desulfoferrobacter suflitae]
MPQRGAAGSISAGVKGYWDNGLHLQSVDDNVRIKLGGRLQVDGGTIWADRRLDRNYPDFTGASAELRRFWVEVAATFCDRVHARLQFDFTDAPAIQDGYVIIHKIPALGRLLLGQVKEPFSLEQLISNVNTTFMEVSLPTDAFAPARNPGLEISDSALAERITWAVGGFWDVGSLDLGNMSRVLQGGSGVNLTGRITGLPWYGQKGRKLLHLGLSYSHQLRIDDLLQVGTQPESDLSGDMLVETPQFQADQVDLVAAELAVVYAGLSLQAELFQHIAQVPETHWLWGYYLYLSYFLTAENRPYDTAKGIFSTLQPRRSFNPLNNSWGAWEIVLRYSYLDLNDTGISGGRESNITSGLNWYLNDNARLMVNYVHADVYDRHLPTIGHGNADIVQSRFQVFF